MANGVTHFEIVGPEPEALQRFYRDAFGWEMRPSGPTYAMAFPHDERGINGGIGAPPEGGQSRVTVYVEVDDLDAALARIEALGGSTETPPTAIPNGPTIALFRDPAGHVLGLTQTTTIRRR